MKTVSMFWLFVIFGSGISVITAKTAHSILDIPPGIPLYGVGILGAMLQFVLVVFPFIIAPVLTGWNYYTKVYHAPPKRETRANADSIAGTMVLLSFLGWIGTGAWFWLFQAKPLIILFALLAPPIIPPVLFWVLFPMTVAMLVKRDAL